MDTVERDRKVATKSEVSYIDIKADRYKSNVDASVSKITIFFRLPIVKCKWDVRTRYWYLHNGAIHWKNSVARLTVCTRTYTMGNLNLAQNEFNRKSHPWQN